MFITAYAQAAAPRTIQLWVGVFGTEQPPTPGFTIDRQAVQPIDAPAFHPIRDRQTGPRGGPVNHQGVFRFSVPDAGRAHLVEVTVGGARHRLSTTTLPAEVPAELDGSFNVLLCSCYFQPEDRQGLLGSIVSQIKVQPHLTLMAGDQVYVDLPLFEDLPEEETELARRVGDKYMRNWASTALQCAGLSEVLARAPVVCLPDDHEFWNNYPFPQKQLPATWTPHRREMLQDICLSLYRDYQVGGAQTPPGAVRLDVNPLKMLFVDTRCDRDEGRMLMRPSALAELRRWEADLLADRQAGRAAVGVLASGQALFVDPPRDESKKRSMDAELGNYEQFDEILQALARLADAGIPVLYLTGDVHWGRVASGVDQRHNRTMLYEVISSPSRLIRVPVADRAKEARNALRGLLGTPDPWPRHSDPDPVPKSLGPGARFKPECQFRLRGDQVAMVSFTRSGSGVGFRVTYYAISGDKAVAKSITTDTYSLQVY